MSRMEKTAGGLIIWILVTNSEHVRVYVRKKKKANSCLVINSYSHDNWAWELISIEPKLQFITTAASKKVLSKDLVAKALATYLNHARAKHLFHRLVLIGPARLHSALRRHFTRTVRLSIIAEQEKELTACSQEEIAHHLDKMI